MHSEQRLTGQYHWRNLESVPARRFDCGYCGTHTSSATGFTTEDAKSTIYVCPNCNGPTFLSVSGGQWPGPQIGGRIDGLERDVRSLYEEAKASIAVGSYTGAVMLCRKILMHVGVEKGADENQSFQTYVKWLIDERHAPAAANVWLDYVRQRGNEANHEIVLMNNADAVGVLKFTEALLRGVYELPSLVPKLPEHTDEGSQETQQPAPEGQ